jgi:hypothetical protein
MYSFQHKMNQKWDRLMVIDDDNKKTMKKAFIIQVANVCLVLDVS